jgi:hypothetical protein
METLLVLYIQSRDVGYLKMSSTKMRSNFHRFFGQTFALIFLVLNLGLFAYPQTGSTGNIVASGTEQSKQVQTSGATTGTTTVNITGSEQSRHYATCPETVHKLGMIIPQVGPNSCTIYDAGNVTLTVNGRSYPASYWQGSTASTIASTLKTAISNDSSAAVTATVSSSSIVLRRRQ